MSNRRRLVWALVPLMFALLFLGGFGVVETTIWLVLWAGWLWLLLVWSRRAPRSARTTT